MRLLYFTFFLFYQTISFAQSYMGYTKNATALLDSSNTEIEIIEKGEAVFIFSKNEKSKHLFVNHIKTNKEGFIKSKEVFISEKAVELTEHNFSTIKDSEEKDPIIKIKNSLHEKLTIKINNIKYEIAPKETQIIKLEKGRQTFVVTSPDMLPHYGRENISEFKMYEWEFYEE